MKVLFYLGHPAHFHLFKNVIKKLKDDNHEVIIIIRKKDVLEDLLNNTGWDYFNFMPKGRKDNKVSIALGLFKRSLKMFSFCLKNKPDLMLGYSTEITHIGKLLNIPSIIVNEDDYTVTTLFAKLGHPFASNIMAPNSCATGPENGKWENKSIHYSGYHELAYLIPEYFKPDIGKISERIDTSKPFYILRFAKLAAHHDVGITGINDSFAKDIISLLKPFGNVYITSERELEPEFEPYRLQIDSNDIHHALYFASMYIGDSQTMAAEAAVLGTPSLRFNDFVGKIGYLEELEHKYKLTFGIKTSEPQKLLNRIKEFIDNPELKKEWETHRLKMIEDSINVTSFMVWVIENYPESVMTLKREPEFENEFRIKKVNY